MGAAKMWTVSVVGRDVGPHILAARIARARASGAGGAAGVSDDLDVQPSAIFDAPPGVGGAAG